ncbi:MAG: bifunctional DNA-formamidopyrimidine glycosylase/DNA-(apurinic or apyrimidinic site) lyase [Wenzhouxiangellaceae bacterium]
MPELPEVETVTRGLRPWLLHRRISGAVIRQRQLRQPVPQQLSRLRDVPITSVERRAKYLLIGTPRGTLIYHLGMTGSLRMIDQGEPAAVHDHVDLLLDDGRAMRFTDPRRFGLIAWHRGDNAADHSLLAHLGPEPFADELTAEYLYSMAAGRRAAVKSFIMDGRIVVGVGNIYASESLHLAGIHPHRPAGRISLQRYSQLVIAIRQVLQAAINAGGTTLRDFIDSDGQPGYFFRELTVYEREGQACKKCGGIIRRSVVGQRSTYYCVGCQR